MHALQTDFSAAELTRVNEPAMLFHLIPDSKFIDGARAVFEKASPGNNRFFVLSDTTESRPFVHIKTFHPEELSARSFVRLVKSAGNKVQAVLIHFLSDDARLALDMLPSRIRVLWFGWGGDYYHLIKSRDDLLRSRTRALMRQLEGKQEERSLGSRVIALTARSVRSPFRTTRELYRRRRLAEVGQGSLHEQHVLSRIEYFVPVIREDAETLAARNPWFGPKILDWNYPELAEAFRIADGFEMSGNDILLGNSATPENNHLDALHALRPMMASDRRIICPLSYGDQRYAELISREGNKMYGRRFVPLRDFVPLSEYFQLVRSCSVVAMPHLRQQAVGNVLMMMYAGARIVVEADNPVFRFLIRKGLPVWPMDRLEEAFGAKAPPPEHDLARTRALLREGFGDDASLACTKRLVSALMTEAGP